MKLELAPPAKPQPTPSQPPGGGGQGGVVTVRRGMIQVLSRDVTSILMELGLEATPAEIAIALAEAQLNFHLGVLIETGKVQRAAEPPPA